MTKWSWYRWTFRHESDLPCVHCSDRQLEACSKLPIKPDDEGEIGFRCGCSKFMSYYRKDDGNQGRRKDECKKKGLRMGSGGKEAIGRLRTPD